MTVTITGTRTQQFATGGDADTDGQFDPGELVRVLLRITNSGTTTATGVTASDPFNGTTLNANSVRITPIAVNEAFNITGNTPITFTAAQLLGNDLDPLGNIATLQITAVSGATNGSIVNNGNGTFTFTPATGLDIGQSASFQYTITDEEGLTNVTGFNGVVTLNITDVVWHVDSGYTGTNGVSDGSFLRPFTSLTELNGVTGDGTTNDDVDSANEAIFINNRGTGYSGGITLENGQRLLGDGVAVSANGIDLGASTGNATINNGGTSNTITLASGNTISGITLGGSTFISAIGDSGGTVGNLTISNTSISGTGGLVSIINGGNLNVAFDSIATTNSAVGGVQLSGGLTGTFSATTGAITNTTISAFAIGSASAGSGGTIAVNYGGTITSSASSAVSVQNHSGGTITFGGNISDTAGSSTSQIIINGNTGGTINFTGAVNVATSAATAVNLTNNGGTTINFNTTGAGLDIRTTGGVQGFVATGGGTVNVTGAGNSINTGAGTGVNIANTTIGGSGVRFDSVTTSGASSGIILNNTGAGTFTVSGTGSANSGGTIDISTGTAGVLLTNTGPVSLTGLSVTRSAADGINGTNVNGLTLSGVTVSNNGNAIGERGVFINGLTGTATITGSTFTGSFDHNVNLINSAGTLNLTVANSQFRNSNGVNGNDGLLLESNGNAITTAHISGSTFDNNAGDHFQFATNGTGNSQNNLTFTGNTLTTSSATNILGGGVTISPSGGDDLVVAVTNNTITGHRSGGAINVAALSTTTGANVQATITGNTIGTAGVASSGAAAGGSGIVTQLVGDGQLTALIDNNRVNEINGTYGIHAVASEGTAAGRSAGGARLNLTLTNNVITNTGVTPVNLVNAIRVEGGTSSGRSNELIQSQISGNTISATTTTGTDIRLRAASASNASPAGNVNIQIRGYTGGATDLAAVSAYVASQNGGVVVSAAPSLSGGLTANGTYGNTPGGAAPALPGTPAAPLLGLVELPGSALASPGFVTNRFEQFSGPSVAPPGSLAERIGYFGDQVNHFRAEVQIDIDGNIIGTSPSPVYQTQFIDPAAVLTPEAVATLTPTPVIDLTPTAAAQTAIVDQATLDTIVDEAIKRWIAAGATEQQIAALRAVEFTIGNLPGIHLGSATPGRIQIDSDGAGFGWFIDATPGDDVEFGGTGTARTGLDGSAATRVDLLTVVLHELGHVIGLEDTYLSSDSSNLLYGYIIPGERRLPAFGQAIGARPGSVTAEAFALAPTLIGTLPAGRAVEISFDSTISALTNQVIVNPSSASTISGTNFTTVTSNSQTLALDTLTVGGSVFIDTNRDGLQNNGEVGPNGVALTLFADTDGNNSFTPRTDVQLATGTTGANGVYSFTGLAPGSYIVRIDAANFTGGGALNGRASTTNAGDPDNNVANDSNGNAITGGIVTGGAITLAYNTEPTAGVGNDTNNTLGFGFFTPNVAPNFATAAAQPSFTENGAFIALVSTATLTDDQTNYSGGTLTVQIATGATTGDELRIRPAGTPGFGIELVGASLRFDGTEIGTITASTATSIAVALNASATVARVRALTEAFDYRSTSDNPTNANRVVTFTLVDGQGTLSGGADTTVLTRTVTVNPVDDAPTAENDAEALTADITRTITVLTNDSDVDGPALSVATVNGVALAVGASTTLASGAVVTRNADGTLGYNPNGAFDFLISPSTAIDLGALNFEANDSFTYTLTGGGTATVTVTVTGVDGTGDQLRGDGGNNSITGTNGVDFFNLSQGGNDTVTGGDGNDAFLFGAAFTAADTVDGGTGSNDQIGLQGNYSGGNALTLGASTISNVEVIAVLPGFSYSITTVDANVAAGQNLTFFGTGLGAGDNFTVDASAETNGTVTIFGGLGTDNFTGGAGNDGFFFGPGRFNPGTDRVNGGAGTNDQVALDGSYTATISATQFQNIEVLALLRGVTGDLANYNLTFADDLVGAGQTFTVFGLPVETGFTLNASAETNGNVNVFGGSGNDTIETGSGNDRIFGGGGADTLFGRSGADTFVYDAVSQSTGANYDRITAFLSGTDRFDFNFTVTGVDARVGSGALSTASFDANLAAIIGAGQLAANHAVLFQADGGDLAGQTFLVVDANGIAGYQAGADYVIRLDSPAASLTVADFI